MKKPILNRTLTPLSPLSILNLPTRPAFPLLGPMPDLQLISLLHQAAASPFGIALSALDPASDLERLRAAKRALAPKEPLIAALSFKTLSDGSIWIVKTISKDE